MTTFTELLSKMSNAVFPVILVLLFFLFFQRKSIRKGVAVRFMLIAASVILIMRMVIFFAGVQIASRYFDGLAVIAICFAPPGVIFIAESLKKLIHRKYPSFSANYAIGIILIICTAICLGKALRFKSDSKKWIYETANTVKEYSKKGKKSVLISNNPDLRTAYYADAQFLKLLMPEDERTVKIGKNGNPIGITPNFGMLGAMGEREYAGKWVSVPGSNSLKDLEIKLREINADVFVLMRMKDEDFRREYINAGIPFPLNIIKTMHDDKKREICLYVLKDLP